MVRRAIAHARWARWLCPLWSRFFRLFFGVRIRGLANVPRSGPLILAPNHQSFFDGQLLSCPTRRPVLFFVAASYFRIPVIGPFLRGIGCIPVGKISSSDAYREGLSLLAEGECLAIFPEGHRSRDGRLLPFRPGAARIAHATGTPIVPVSILGAFEAWPRHRWLPRPFRPIVLKYHRPIPCPRVEKDRLHLESTRTTARIVDTLERRISAWERVRRRASPRR